MAVTQSHYRFGKDDGTESTHTWWANEDTNPTSGDIAEDVPFLLRFTLQCNATARSNVDAEFQYRKNGGTWTQITTSTTNVKAVAVGAFTNGQHTTKRLSGTGTFEASSAGCTEDGISGGNAFDIVANGNGETECGLQIVGADVVGGDVLDFRLTRDGGVLLDTYAVTPSYTMGSSTTPISVAATAIGVAAASKQLSLQRAIAAVALGVAAVTRLTTYKRAVAAVALGVASVTKGQVFQKVVAAVAVGVAAVTTRLTVGKTIAATAIGVAVITRQVGFTSTVAAVAIGVAGVSALLSLSQIVTAIAIGIATVGTLFIPAAGGGGGMRALTALKRLLRIRG